MIRRFTSRLPLWWQVDGTMADTLDSWLSCFLILWASFSALQAFCPPALTQSISCYRIPCMIRANEIFLQPCDSIMSTRVDCDVGLRFGTTVVTRSIGGADGDGQHGV